MPSRTEIYLTISLMANIFLLVTLLAVDTERPVDTETPVLKERNKNLLIRNEELKYLNDSLKQIKKGLDTVYYPRLKQIYEIHDTNLVDSVRAVLSRVEMPTNPH